MKKNYLRYLLAFLLSIIVAAPVFSTCTEPAGTNSELSAAHVPNKKGMYLKGRITDNEHNPVAGVVVNDGTNFTVTDKKGIYYLPSDLAKNKYVSISVPAGFEIQDSAGIACGFYAKLTYGKEVNRRDFILKKRSTPSNEFVYIAISDPQVKNSIQLDRFRNETVPDLKKFAASLPGKEIYGMTLGDNVWDAMGLFPDYKRSVSSLGFTIFHTIGNHDFDQAYNDLHNTPNPLENYGEETYENYFGPVDYSFNVGDVHVVTMKDIDYFKGKKYTEQFTPEQLVWLKRDLSYVKQGTVVFLNLHAPTSNKTEKGEGNVTNAAELMEILKGYKVHIFAGHTHFYENAEITADIYEHNIGAACGAWWAGNVNRCGAPNGYLVVYVKGNDVKWNYKATAQTSEYQFRLYKPGEFLSQPRYVVANVWDWDSQYKVNIWEDGQLKGSMEQFEDVDQDYLTMTGKPNGYRTRHLFRYTPTAGVKNIKVEVINRFGESFTQSLSLSN